MRILLASSTVRLFKSDKWFCFETTLSFLYCTNLKLVFCKKKQYIWTDFFDLKSLEMAETIKYYLIEFSIIIPICYFIIWSTVIRSLRQNFDSFLSTYINLNNDIIFLFIKIWIKINQIDSFKIPGFNSYYLV